MYLLTREVREAGAMIELNIYIYIYLNWDVENKNIYNLILFFFFLVFPPFYGHLFKLMLSEIPANYIKNCTNTCQTTHTK